MNARDARLLQALRDDRRNAFETVVQQHYRSVFGQMWHLTGGDAEAAADLTQEAFVEAWRSLGSFTGRSSLRTWLHTVAVRVWMRHRSRYAVPSCPVGEALDAILDCAVDPLPGPVARAEVADARRALGDALRSLPAEYREAVRLHYYLGMPLPEVAATLRIPVGTVKSRLHRALGQMYVAMSDAADEPQREPVTGGQLA